MHDPHSHRHDHAHAPANFGRAFAVGIALNAGFVLVEVLFGLRSHSLSLVADAGHNLSDVLSLFLAWGASILVRRAPTVQRTYGWRRASVLTALLNAALLLVAIGAIAWEAIQRFRTPAPVAGGTVIVVALIGILVNGATALLFASGRKGDMNIRGAFLHMATDAGVSLGVMIAGVLILLTGWTWLDPTISLAIVVIVFASTWGLLRDSVNLALDAVPASVDPAAVRTALEKLPGVAGVHDVHIWAMSTTEIALTAHLVAPDHLLHDALLFRAADELHDRFEIEHATLQIESGDPAYPCPREPADVV